MNTTLLYGMATCMALIVSRPLTAQTEVPEMSTDRPDQTESSTLLPAGWLQVEIGVQTEQTTIYGNGLDEKSTANAYPDVLVRYGLLPAMELRLIVGYQEISYGGASISGVGPVSIGAKIAVCSEEGLRPEIAFLGHLAIPKTGREEFSTQFLAPQFRFSVSHTLSDMFSLGYNLGAEWDGESAMATGVYTATLGIGVSDQIGVFAELFGELPEIGDAVHNFDGGITYALLPNVQIDASGGLGLTDSAPDFFAGIGISFRLPR